MPCTDWADSSASLRQLRSQFSYDNITAHTTIKICDTIKQENPIFCLYVSNHLVPHRPIVLALCFAARRVSSMPSFITLSSSTIVWPDPICFHSCCLFMYSSLLPYVPLTKSDLSLPIIPHRLNLILSLPAFIFLVLHSPGTIITTVVVDACCWSLHSYIHMVEFRLYIQTAC